MDRMGQQYFIWEVLRDALHLPENVDLVDIKMDHITDRIIMYLRSPDLPERYESAYPVIVNATYRRNSYVDGPHEKVEFIGWSY